MWEIQEEWEHSFMYITFLLSKDMHLHIRKLYQERWEILTVRFFRLVNITRCGTLTYINNSSHTVTWV